MSITKPVFVNFSAQGPQWAKFVDFNNDVQWAFPPPRRVFNPRHPASNRQGAARNRPASSICFGSK